MGLSFIQKVTSAWAVLRGRYDGDTGSDVTRWQGRVFAELVDHGVLRHWWRNEGRIADGLYRSNHPNARALAMWKARGIRDVISLRPQRGAVHAFEAATCEALGLRLRNAALTAREAPRVAGLVALLDALDTLQLPALIHCKSGADRTGLVAAIWAIHVDGRPVAEARKGLSLRYWHVKWSHTGVLDRFLDAYAARLAQGDITLREWIETEYDPTTL